MLKNLQKPDVICLNLMKQKKIGLAKMLINNITPIFYNVPYFITITVLKQTSNMFLFD